MADEEPQRTSVTGLVAPLTLVTFILSIVMAICGYLINRTLTNIDDSISNILTRVEDLKEVRLNHEYRLRALEGYTQSKFQNYKDSLR